jgi:hypothetical protein
MALFHPAKNRLLRPYGTLGGGSWRRALRCRSAAAANIAFNVSPCAAKRSVRATVVPPATGPSVKKHKNCPCSRMGCTKSTDFRSVAWAFPMKHQVDEKEGNPGRSPMVVRTATEQSVALQKL